MAKMCEDCGIDNPENAKRCRGCGVKFAAVVWELTPEADL